MKQILCAVLVMAILSIPCFPQGEHLEESLRFKPLEYLQRKKVDDLNRKAKAQAAQRENSPLANSATGYSLFFRLIGELPASQSLERSKLKLRNLGITDTGEQNFIIQKSKEFVQMSRNNKIEAEKVVIKYHVPGSKHHNEFSENDKKVVKKLWKEKEKSLKKLIHDLKKDISDESFDVIENYVLNSINPRTHFDLTPTGEIEVEKMRREGKSYNKAAAEVDGGDPPDVYYSGYTVHDYAEDIIAGSGGDADLEDTATNGSFLMAGKVVYEVDPMSNSHGLSLYTRVVNQYNSQVLAYNYIDFVWVQAGGQTSFSLENNFTVTPNDISDEWEGSYIQQAKYETWCGGSYGGLNHSDYIFGFSTMRYEYSHRDEFGQVYAKHMNHSRVVGGQPVFDCPTACGELIKAIKPLFKVYFRGNVTYWDEITYRTAVATTWNRDDEGTFCARHAYGVNLGVTIRNTVTGGVWAPVPDCFDTSFNLGWIWN